MSSLRTTRVRSQLIASAACVFAVMGGAQAQPAEAPVSPGEVYFDQAAEFYSARDYAAAVPFLIQAVQADPMEPRFYRGLARAAHYAEQYELATWYYDLYLGSFPEHARAERSRDNREDAIRNERQRANANRASAETPVALPTTQRAALDALNARIATGPYMAEDGSGAWSIYEALLRSGYAHPNLVTLRSQLAAGILAETEAMFQPPSNAPVAIVSTDDWRAVPRRFALIREMQGEVLDATLVAARQAAARGQVLLINENYSLAAEEFRAAANGDPNLIMAYWGLILSYHGETMNAGRPMNPHATVLVDTLERLTRESAPQHLPLVSVARSIVWYDLARYQESAEALMDLLAPGHVAPPQGSAARPQGTTVR